MIYLTKRSVFGLNVHHNSCRLNGFRGLSAMRVSTILNLWVEDDGQDIAEYAVMLAAIMVIVVGTIRLVGSHTNTVFSQVASNLQ